MKKITLGSSGPAVGRIGLGLMGMSAFYTGASSDDAESIRTIHRALELGVTLLDTAEMYGPHLNEELLGKALAGRRGDAVVATKFGTFHNAGDGSYGLDGTAANVRASVEGSLRRLGTDFIDMYWTHVWDRTTPPEEVLRALTDAVRRGDILYYGFSNAPAWYAAQIATLARAHGLPEPIALQYSYSLIDRGVELDVVPAGQALGLGLVAWSPLAAGMLTGKYDREKIADAGPAGSLPNRAGDATTSGSDGRLNGDNPYGGMLFTEKNFDVVDALRSVASEIGRPMAQLALAWVVARDGVASVLVGASRPEQLLENIVALDIVFSADQQARLDAAGAPPMLNPYFIFDLPRARIFGGQDIEPWAPVVV